MGLYFEHAQFVWEEVLKHNKIPMLWADMFLGNGRLDLINRIDKRVILVPWDYTSMGKTSRFVIYRGHRSTKNSFTTTILNQKFLLLLPEQAVFLKNLIQERKI